MEYFHYKSSQQINMTWKNVFTPPDYGDHININLKAFIAVIDSKYILTNLSNKYDQMSAAPTHHHRFGLAMVEHPHYTFFRPQ